MSQAMNLSDGSIIRGRVVVIDDDKEMRTLLEDFLRNSKYEVFSFPLALEALTALSTVGRLGPNTEAGAEIDVIISDIKMAQLEFYPQKNSSLK